MPDITMCANNNECKKKDSCYRNVAKPSRWQSYASFYDQYRPNKKCEYYWEILPEKKLNTQRKET